MNTAYSYVELKRAIPLKIEYAPNESRERLNTFSAKDGYSITSDGIRIRIAKEGCTGDAPFSDVVVALQPVAMSPPETLALYGAEPKTSAASPQAKRGGK